MEILNLISKSTNTPEIIRDLSFKTEGEYDLGLLFFSPRNRPHIEEVVEGLRKTLKIKNMIGCTGAGIIATDEEMERQPAVSLILAKFPQVMIRPFYIQQVQLDGLKEPKDWYEFLDVYPTENPIFILLPDPFNLNLNMLMSGLNRAYPKCPVVGGIASASNEPNGNTLFVGHEFYSDGAVGLILSGNLLVDTVVSQGCRPIGETFIVTKAKENIIYEIAGQNFFKVINEVVEKSNPRDKQLAQEAIFVGVAMDEYKDNFKRGDFVIRGLMGIDEKNGAGYLGDYIKTGQTIQFHVRDAQTATEDLNALLDQQQKTVQGKKPKGALLFSCNGRGEYLFRQKNHDITIIHNHVGKVPTAGFFCAGEIGPVGKSNFLHGFTDSLVLFYSKE